MAVISEGDSRLGNLLAAVGRPMAEPLCSFGRLLRLFRETLRFTFRRGKDWNAIFAQMYEVGNRSLVFIAVTLGFLGVISIYQTATQIQRILPDFSMLGATFIQILIRQFAPSITALMIATRVGTGIAAEIGSMVVTEQVDALKMSNTHPVPYLVVPRFIACGTMLLVLALFALVVATVAGMLTGWIGFDINPRTFINFSLIDPSDVALGVCKTLSFGFAIPVISAQAGLEATGGSEGVGWATTRAVVNASFAVVVLDFTWSAVGYLVF